MTEHSVEQAPSPHQVRTGHEGVDAVLDSLDDLAQRPVDDHVAVFERAHDELRRALSGAREQG